MENEKKKKTKCRTDNCRCSTKNCGEMLNACWRVPDRAAESIARKEKQNRKEKKKKTSISERPQEGVDLLQLVAMHALVLVHATGRPDKELRQPVFEHVVSEVGFRLWTPKGGRSRRRQT